MSQKWFKWFMIATAFFVLGASMCSCTQQEEIDPLEEGACMLGPCSVELYPDPANQPNAYLDENGYWHLEYFGAPNFNIVAIFSALKNRNVRGTIPMIKSFWDTSYWYTVSEGITLWASSYSPFGDFTNNFTYAIANNTYQIIIPRIEEVYEIYNLSGQFMRNGELGPDKYTFVGSSYKSKLVCKMMKEQVGDTITIWNKSFFGYDRTPEEVSAEIKVIIE